MKMRNIFLTVFLIAGIAASAQDRKANALLNQVAEKTQSYEFIRIDFEYRMINKAQGINETLDGILLSKGDKYKLNVAGQQIISDGKTMWTFLESVNEVQINEPMEEDEGFNPRSFLQNWDDNFKAKTLSEAGNEVLLELMPKETSSFVKVHVTVDKNKKQLMAISMFDSSGNEFVYSITHFSTGASISDNEFHFNPDDYPGIEVIDLR
jgi:outer membrane lipoprotein carrier protein